MSKHSDDKTDPRRRSLIKMGVGLGAGAAAMKSGLALAKETITYPSADEIVPPEWRKNAECILTSNAIEGPYYLPTSDFRRDIRDGQPGQKMRLELEVYDATRCQPIPGAVVQVWHCNAGGHYSGYPEIDPDELPQNNTPANQMPHQGAERFLRGAQVSDEAGQCEFLTIYPGWYAGRATHIHLKVFFNDSRLITGQLYFPQDLSDAVHQTGPYAERGVSPYRNATDVLIARSAGAAGSWPTMSEEGDAYVGTLRVTVLNPHYDHIRPGWDAES